MLEVTQWCELKSQSTRHYNRWMQEERVRFQGSSNELL